MFAAHDIPARLAAHLETWLGAWPPEPGAITVVGYRPRTEPGWDGLIHEVIGVATNDAAVLSVPPEIAGDVANLVHGLGLEPGVAALADGLQDVIGHAGQLGRGRFRWSDHPTPGPDVGEWVPTTDARVPPWLKPFNGDVLVAWDDDGRYGGGVGRKQHDRAGHEISVGTEESLRGRGIARKLVATAARRILDDGAIPTYLHAFDNHASAKVAEAAGFADVGWTVLNYFEASARS